MVGVGQRIGNYRILRKLGQGGMGAVYEAVQEQIGRRAAIKVLHPEYANDQQSTQRFFNEARAVNIIHHPGLVGVFESGRLDDGAYIVMEYLDGELLSGRLEKANHLGQRDVLNFGRQIASALAAAHAKGIVHRDLKPDNIMIVSDPETVDGERIKIFDFGIAKLRLNSLAPSRAPTGMRTQTGMIMGTPTHMAPEQCRGASDIDGKADVYSLGVILFQMLVGHPPFVADSAGELMSMHLRDKPPNLRKLDPSIPEELTDLVHQMLAKEPTARPDMGEVVAQLEAMGAHRTRRTGISKPTAPSRSAGWNVGGAASSTDRGKPRAAVHTLQQAVGQTLNTMTGRRFAVAIAVAVLLVVVSGVLLFEAQLATFGRSSQPTDVTWSLDSEPSGATILSANGGEILGLTPWYHREVRREGTLRVFVQLKGYRGTTVVLNYSESTTQKISLEQLAAGEPQTPTSAGKIDNPPEPATPPALVPVPTAPVGLTPLLPTPALVVPGPPGKKLRWQLATRPRGAEVTRADNGVSLGKTPLKFEQEAQNSLLKLILRLDGYQETSVILDLTTGSKQTVTLQRIGPPRDKPADKTTEKAPDKATDKATDKPAEKAVEKAADKPAEKAPADKEKEKPADKEKEKGSGEPSAAGGESASP